MDENRVQELWMAFKEGNELGSLQEFKSFMSDPKNRSDFHSAFKDSAELGDINQFEEYLGVKKKVSSKNSAFDWGTGTVDVQKLSSTQPTAPTAAEKSNLPPLPVDSIRESINDFNTYNDVANPTEQEARAKTETPEKFSAYDYIVMGGMGSQVKGVLSEGAGALLKGAGELVVNLHKNVFDDKEASVDKSWFYQAGDALQGMFRPEGLLYDEKTQPLLNSTLGQIGSGTGQLAFAILTGGASVEANALTGVAKSTPILKQAAKQFASRPSVIGAIQMVDEAASDIRQQKSIVGSMSEDEYVSAASAAGDDPKLAREKYNKLKDTEAEDLLAPMLPTILLAGSTESFNVAGWFQRMNKVTGNSFSKVFLEKMKDVSVGTVEGAAQEALQQWMTNTSAKDIYDYTLETTDGMWQSAKVGGGTQFVFELLGAALGKKINTSSGKDTELLKKAKEELDRRGELLARNLDNEVIASTPRKDMAEAIAARVEAGEMSKKEGEKALVEFDRKNQAMSATPEEHRSNPDVIDTMVEKTKVDEEIATKKESIKTIDPAFQQDAKNEIAALEVKSAELALQVAEKAGVTPDEKAVKVLEPKEGEQKPVPKIPEPPKVVPVKAADLEVGKKYYNEEFDREYVFTGTNEAGMLTFDKVPKKGETLMNISIDSLPDAPFMRKMMGPNSEVEADVKPVEQAPVEAPVQQEMPVPVSPALETARAMTLPQEQQPPTEPEGVVNPDTLSDMPPPTGVPPEMPAEQSGGVKKRVLTERAYEGDIRAEVRSYLEEKGLTRERVSQAERSSQASQMVDDIGEDMAVEAVKMGEVKGALASATLFDVIKRVDDRMSNTEDSAEIDYLAKKQADLIEMLNDMAFEGGEFNSQFAREYVESDIGWNLAVKKRDYVKMFGSIPADVEAKFEELDSQLKELNAKLREAEKRAAAAADAATIETIKKEAEKKKPTQKSIAVVGKEIAKKIRKGKLSRPGTFSAASPASVVWDAAIEIAATAVEAGTALAEAVRLGIEHIRSSAWYAGLSRDKQMTAEQEYSDFLLEQEDTVGATKIPKSLIRDLVGSGISDINDLVDAVRNSLGLVEESDREIRDAITEYGKTINMTKDDISVEVRRLRRVGRLISALEDVAEKKRPLRSGLQRDKLTAEERSLRKQLNEEMKALPIDEETAANEQRTALDAAKRRVENQIEDIQREIDKGEQVRRSTKTFDGDQELEDLKAKLAEKRKEHDEIFKNEEYLNARRLENTKKRTKKSIAELERRLAEKDFSKKEVKPLLEDNELIALRAEKLRIKEQYDRAFYEAEVKNRSKRENVISAIWEAWGLTRVLTASLDASFMFVQGGVMTISNPRHAIAAVKEVMNVIGSEERANEFARKMKSQEWYPLAKQSKLALTEAHTGVRSSEELFFSGWSDFLWNGAMFPFKLAGDQAYKAAVAKNPFKATERAAVAYLDTLRIMKFQEMLDGPLRGKNFSDNKQEFKDVADAINTLTGRASLGKLETISQPLTKLIFSPRNWASQVKMFSPYSIYYFGSLTPSARKMALLSLGKFVAFNTSMMMLLAAIFNEDDDEETNVEFDPRSSDFMKLKMGDVRVDPWGGKIQQVTFASRMMMDLLFDFGVGKGGFKNNKGKILPLGMKNKTSDKKDLILQQVFNKLSPSARLVYNYVNAQRTKDGKQDDFGNEYSLAEDVKKSLYPMYVTTIAELGKDGFDVTDSVLTFFALMGYGVNRYGKKEKKKKDEK